ncbi:MAG: TraR/DksA family transcriptional regulator [Candidatus Omnitrophota bacterium]
MTEKKFDDKTRESYKRLLIKLKENIIHDIKNMSSAEAASSREDSGDVSGHALHMADVATDMYDREFNLGLASNDRELLTRIELALKRVDDRSYGLCIECKKSIPIARLKAIPYVETCLKCQEQIEEKQWKR